MTGLLDIDTNIDSEGISIFYKNFNENNDKKLKFSDFSKAFLPCKKNDAELILQREPRNLKREKSIQ